MNIVSADDAWVWSDGDTVAVLGAVTPNVIEIARGMGALQLVHHQVAPLPEVADVPFSLDVRRRAEAIKPSGVPGVRLSQVEDVATFIACHRAAWDPHALPFATPRIFPAEAASSFDAPRWDVVRNDPWFDPELVVVAYENDVPVASCIAWCDSASGAAEIEPAGGSPAGARARLG